MKNAKPAYKTLAAKIAATVAALPDQSPAQVLAVFQDAAKHNKKMVVCDAFWHLDLHYPAIRALRNHPDYGLQLFALWS